MTWCINGGKQDTVVLEWLKRIQLRRQLQQGRMKDSEPCSTRVQTSGPLTSGFLYRLCIKTESPRHMVACHLSVPTCNYECPKLSLR